MQNGSDQPYIEALKKASDKIKALLEENARLRGVSPVAVVGLACRFPGGADTPAKFWNLLTECRDAVTQVPADRWDAGAWYDADPEAAGKMYANSGGFLDDVRGFDPSFFNLTPKEARSLDPQQRLLLELSWEAFESAGMDTRRLAGGRTGVFIGLSNYDYIQAHVHSGDPTRIDAYSGNGAMFSTAAGRLSYFYDFKGPCITVDTACSSSLVAVDLAIKSLRRGECDQALVGGISLMLSPDSMVALCKIKALAADGRCRAFDDAASGYGRGEGAGLLVLKRLDDARRDGDTVHAIVAGSAINHDGRSNGLTAPNGLAQQQVIRDALADAALAPEAIHYVEAHGTGTSLGDPIEFGALAAVFGKRPMGRELWLGSVKTNIGHTEAAAGIAGMIKVILALQNRRLPESLHFSTPNKHIDWASAAIKVVDRSRDWPAGDGVRAAGVSSFGLSGTNVHVVVVEAPQADRPDLRESAGEGECVLPLSAATAPALRALVACWRERLQQADPAETADLCRLVAGRTPLRERLAVVGAGAEGLAAALASVPESRFARSRHRPAPKGPVFLFGSPDGTDRDTTALHERQLELVAKWRSLGVRPVAVLGCGAGEWAAATVAGMVESDGRKASLPFYSGADGGLWLDSKALAAAHWQKRPCRRPDLEKAVAAMLRDGYDLFVEIGPVGELAVLLDARMDERHLRIPAADGPAAAGLAALWERGLEVDWATFGGARRPCAVEAPTYPFQREPYWLEIGPLRRPGAGDPAPRATEPPLPEPVAATSEATPAAEDPTAKLISILAEVSGFSPQEIDPAQHLMEMGLDSLMLLKMGQMVEQTYGVELQISQMFTELGTVNGLAAYLAERGAHRVGPAPVQAPVQAAQPAPASVSALPSGDPELQIIRRQLAELTAQVAEHRQRIDALSGHAVARLPAAVPARPVPVTRAPREGAVAALRGINLAGARLTPAQDAFVTRAVADHVARTPGSKAMTGESRSVLADWKHTLSFWGQLKEAKYPIVSARSQGARFWDVDGNEYIDVALGMGVHFFGHKPAFVHEALARQMEAGLELGTQSKLTGAAAKLLCELTGNERVTFSNTGSEVVMVALRLARAVTGRAKIVIFRNSYHGIFDGVLATEEDGRIAPIGIGTLPAMVEDVVVLDYDAPESLRFIEANAQTIAGVLVEPVQSRHPDLQPQGFLKELRRITRAADTALIFDEMINGFRILPGGAQAWFGVDADIALYGKIVGGGMPIGVIAGKARFLDYIDGGAWDYGDRSGPQTPMIYFGGTFCRNPATMATTHAALAHMLAEGPALQTRTTALTTAFCDRLNRWFEVERVPLRAEHFSSQWRLAPLGEKDRQPIELELLYLRMNDRGVYTWERRISFFSTSHTQADAEAVFRAITESVLEIRAAGFAWSIAEYPSPQFTLPSSVQRRLFALGQREGGQLPYHLPQAFRIDGPLDVDRLEAAFRTIVTRHESLRTSFVTIEGELLAKRWAEPRFAVERLRADESGVDAVVAAFVRPFDLAVAPLLRVAAVEIAPERHLLLADAHHIVADGLSFNVIAAELMALYQGLDVGPVAYDLRRCQALVDAGGEGERGRANLAFWQEQLAGDLPVLDLPADRPRPAEPDFKGDTVTLTLPAETTRRLRALGRESGASLYIVLLAVWTTLLHRLTGQTDIVVGGAASGRRDLAMNAAVGMFVNTIALRTAPDAEQPFRRFLAAVARASIAVYDHQDYPFEHLLKLAKGRPGDRNPVFDTMLSYENAGERTFRIESLTFAQHEIHLPAAMFDLTLEAIEAHDVLSLRFSFATSLFERSTVARWVASFERIVAEVLADPDRPLGRIDVLGPQDRSLIARFNETAAGYPASATLLDLFEASARRHPERPVVRFGDTVLTYAALDRWSDELASHLAVRAEAGSRVGIFLERSEAVVAAILAVFKAGCAYVPLDTAHPDSLIAHALSDSDCRVVLTSKALVGRLPEAMRGRALAVEDAKGEVGATLASRPEAGSPAYVIYTSGSTGHPKGCLITHRNVVRLVVNERLDFEFDERDVWLCAHSFAFDFSVWEVWGALAYGGQVVIARQDEIRDPAARLSLIQERRVSVLSQTPGAFYGLIEAECASPVHGLDGHLRYVVFGGDRLEPTYLRPWAARYPADRIALVNMYGITETTVHVSHYRLREDDISGPGGRSPIGRPLPETTIAVLNPSMAPQPVGVPGELWVGGSGVGIGYLNRPEMTAERFVEHDGQRLYRSGDLGRLGADGVLEYLGRNDDQVQVRGYRVELGTVTRELLAHPGIAKALVTDREGAPGVRELVAYLVDRKKGELAVDDLRDHLERALPAYMVPSHFVVMDEFPLTANGKIDRKALPAPEAARMAGRHAFVAPRGPVEAAIASVWQQVLGLPKVSVEDNFFAIGGDSIRALRIVSGLHRAGLRASVTQIFAARTVARLAELVAPDAGSALPSPVPGASAERCEASLTPIQHWFMATQRHAPGHFTNAVLLAADAPVDVPALQGAVDRIVAHHDALRLSLAPEPPRQRIAERIAVPVETVAVADVTALTAHAETLHGRFDVARPPLLRIVHYRLPEGERVMVLCHHLVIDGISWRIVLEDLTAVYGALATGRPVPELAASRPWLDWAGILGDYSRSARLLAEIDYWRAVEEADVPAVPRDFESAGNAVGDAASVAFSLDPKSTRALLTEAQGFHGVRINALLLGGLGHAFRKTFGLNRLRIRLEGHGREEIEPGADFSRTVGWFTSIFPLVVDLAEADGTAAAAKQVEAALRKLPAKGVGYGILKFLTPAELRGGLTFGRAPEIGFNYLGQFAEGTEGGFVLASEPTGASQSAHEQRQELIDVESMVIDDNLSIVVNYGRHIHSAATMQAFAAAFEEGLRALARGASTNLPAAVLMRLGLAADEVEAVLHLSPLQEGMLFHAAVGDRTAYFEQFTFRVTGEVDLACFKAAWQALARRHPILRAAIVDDSGARPVQVIRRERPIPIEDHDFGSLPAAERNAAVEALMKRDRERGFDLERDPLMRLHLVRLGPKEFDVVWSSHHIIVDGWSMGILQDEFTEIYDALSSGRPSRLPPAPSFAGHIDWLAAWDSEPARRYWRRELEDCPAPSTIAATKPAVEGQDYVQRLHDFKLSEAETEALSRLGIDLEVTLNTIVQSLWAILLARHNGTGDVVFGAVVSGRPPYLEGVEKMVGLFLQTVPVRVRLEAGTSFAAIARGIQDRATAAEPFNHLALSEIQRLNGVRRSLFDHVLVFENYPTAVFAENAPFQVGDLRSFEQMHFAFSLVLQPGSRLEVTIPHNANLFDEFVFAGIEAEFRALVADVLDDAHRPVALAPARAGEPDGSNAIVLDLFERHAAAAPGRTAVECGGRSVSFGALDARAGRLAGTLAALGVGPSVPVAILLRNGIDHVASILAVQKAGGLFVPVDVDQPERRREKILARIEPAAIVTDAAGKRALGACAVPVIVWKADGGFDAPASAGDASAIARRPRPGDAAYVMFTSGSTGEPKAILSSHEALHHFIQWELAELQVRPSVRVANLAPTTFDVSLRDIFLPLAAGGTVCVPDAETRQDPARLAAWLDEARVEVIHVVPSLFRLLLNELERSGRRPAHLAHLLFAGEALWGADLARVCQVLGDRVVVRNCYGPTETTLFKCCMTVGSDPIEPGRMVPVGRPIGGTRVMVVKDGRPAAKGALGEIHILPPFKALGYFRDAAATQAAFLPAADLFGTDGTAYRTGDLGRELADGTIEFCGRLDGQVKVNGIRIELAEIEAAARAVSGVDQVAAVAHKRPDGDNAIACYYAGKAGLEPADVRERLAQDLPRGMIPQFLVRMESLPLNINGKVDRRSLPKPEEMVAHDAPFEEPADAIEAKIAAIWAEVLGIRRIGATVPFFAIGGDSLRAMRVIARVNQAFERELSLAAFFKDPTVRGIAGLVRDVPEPPKEGCIPVAPRAADYPLSHAQSRMWALAQMGGHPAAYTLPAAYLLEGRLDPEKLKGAIEALVVRHESLRTAFVEVDGRPRQKILENCPFTVKVPDLSRMPDAMAEAERLAYENEGYGFDLERAPLFRAAILRLGEERHVLLVNIHHIVSDAWSLNVMVDEVLHLMRGQNLPPLRVQYKDYALWEAAELRGRAARAMQRWWIEALRGLPERMSLPTDRPWPDFYSFHGARVGIDLPEDAIGALRAIAGEAGISLFAGLLGLVAVALHRHGGETDFVVGTPVANRDDVELDRQVGFYVNTLPLRLRLDGGKSFRSLLAGVWDTLTAALDHREYPFDLLIEALALPRDLGRPPLFDVLVVFQDGGQRQLVLDGVTVRPFADAAPISKMPLSFEFTEIGRRVRLNLEYSTDLFERDRMLRLAGHVCNLLQAVVAAPEAPLASIDILGETERRLLMGADAAVSLDLPQDATIPGMFAAVVKAHARKTAVIHEESRLTYAELDGRANALAHALIEVCGVRQGDTVAVLMERSASLPVAFLGVVKAGAVYLPLDPTYPEDRLRHMLEDSGAATVVVDGAGDGVSAGHDCRLFNLGSLGRQRARAAGLPTVRPSDLAYMIYTSGSTGLPKGARLEHRGVANCVLAQRHVLGIGPQHRVLQFAPLSFDASVWELIMALLNGAALVVAGPERIREAAALGAFLRQHRVTAATFPPTYLGCLEDADLDGLEIVVSAGEPPKVDQALRLAAKLAFYNGYGPTETTICATLHRVDPIRDRDRPIPIGRAIPNTEVLVLDREGRLAPVGVPGEIHVAGVNLARDYHSRPALTESVFVAHPFRPGERMYRTGDIGVVSADGEILFLGRRDGQVKVRGHRVETAEIERTLLGHPNVEQAVVVMREGDLAAYVVLAGETPWNELRDALARRLPDYMQPARWTRLDAIPLLPNGKVDFAALPDPRQGGTAETPEIQAEEALVAGIWQEVLLHREFGPHDHFFESGGDSIKAIQVVGRLRRAGFQIDMRGFLESPTVASLAARLKAADRTAESAAPDRGLADHADLSSVEIEELLDGE